MRPRSQTRRYSIFVQQCLFVILLCGSGCQSSNPIADSAPALTESESEDHLLDVQGVDEPRTAVGSDFLNTAQDRLRNLTSPAFFGRGYLFNGHRVAAEFIASEFDSIGLDPLDGSYFQFFDLEADLFPDTPELSLNGNSLETGIDFLPFPGSSSGSVSNVEVVDVGFGLYDPSLGISDYELDVAGKVIVARSGIPDSLSSKLPSEVGTTEYKAAIAASRSGKGLIVLKDNLVYGLSRANPAVPVFDVLSTSASMSVRTASFRLNSQPDTPIRTQNVLGYLPATRGSISDSLIIVVAHYDHQGAIGPNVYFPGANDNASGVTLMLDIAQHFASRTRSSDMLFVAFSGEEVGLLGSFAFAEQPPVDLGRVSMLINLDMVASAEDGVVVMGGVEHSADFSMIKDIGKKLDESAGEVRRIRARTISPISDHYPLAQIGVKAFYFYTNKGKQPYHHINDVAETLEWDDYLYVRRLVINFIELAQ